MTVINPDILRLEWVTVAVGERRAPVTPVKTVGMRIFVVSIALTQMNIGEKILANAILILFGAVCLALALAFGLGCQQLAGRWVSDLIDQVKTRKH